MIDFSFSDTLIVIIFLALTILIPVLFRQKNRTLADYFQSGGKLSWFVAGTAIVATTFAADTPLAVTELVSKYGISGNWVWWYAAIGSVFTAYVFAPLWKRSGALTDIELVRLRYSGRSADFLRILKSIYLGFFMNILIMSWVNVAMVKICKVILPGYSTELIVTSLFLFAFLYTAFMGLTGISYADTFQFFFAMGGCILLAYFALGLPEIGGIAGLKDKLPEETFNFFPDFSNPKTNDLSIGSFLILIMVVWWSSWYPGAEPGGGGYVAQRIMAARDERSAMLSALWFTIAHYFVRPWPWIIVALCSMVLFPGLPVTEKGQGFVLIMQKSLPTGMLGLMTASFIAAYLSTIATHLNWGSSYIVTDFVKPYVLRGREDRFYFGISAISQLLMMTASLLISFFVINSISDVWVFLLECGSGVGFVLIFRWFWPRLTALSEIASFLFPAIYYLTGKFVLKIVFPYSILFTVAATIISVIAVTFLSKPVDIRILTIFYQRVLPPGFLWRNWAIANNIPLNAIAEDSYKKIILVPAGIVLVISALFTSGYLIFAFYEKMMISLLVFTASFAITLYLFPRKKK
ncbi:MAG: Na+:solute symporter [Leptospira sp.]|nr:Na+:solute symporter [Leptospira sp.]